MQFDLEPGYNYHGVRWRWCRATVLALIRRWAAFLGVVMAVIGVQLAYVLGALAWVELPLLQAAARGWMQGLLAMLLYGLLGGLLMLALRPLLLPRHWFEVERALPLAPGTLRRSDMRITAWALLPLALIYALSCGVWLHSDPAWLLPVRGRAMALVAGSLALSWWLGVAALQWPRRQTQATVVHATAPGAAMRPIKALPWWWALWLLAMWRGPARQLGLVSALGTAWLLLCVAGVAAMPGWASWWLAGFAAAALLLATRVRALQEQIWPHWQPAMAALPVSPRHLRRVEQLLALLPIWLALMALVAVLLCGPLSPRPMVLALYLTACLLGPWLQARQRAARRGDDPAARAAYWFITLVLMLALASEVLPNP